MRPRTAVGLLLGFAIIYTLVRTSSRDASKPASVFRPLPAARAPRGESAAPVSAVPVVLCCATPPSALPPSSSRGYVWRDPELSEEQMERCKKLFQEVTVLQGPLEGIWPQLSSEQAVSVFDDNIRGPASTFFAYILLKDSVRVEFHTEVVQPREHTVEADVKRVTALRRGKDKFKAVVKQLRKQGRLEQGFGYHPERMAARWQAMRRSLEAQPLADETTPIMVDWGSNAGFFSVKLAQRYRQGGQVIGVEGEAVQEYDKARNVHREMAEKEGVLGNTLICATKVSGQEFQKVAKLGQFDLQLTLSIFHWFSIRNHDHFLEMLGWHLAQSRTTFLELPEARIYGEHTGQAMAERLNPWYGGVLSESELVKRSCELVNMPCTVTNLGTMFHDTGTVRTMLRVDVPKLKEKMPLKDFQDIVKCKKK